jgi:hypothetical protein
VDLAYPGHVYDLGASFWNRVCETFRIDARIVASQPAIVETEFRTHFFRTLAAYVAKFPAQLELGIRQGNADMFWNLVGGWEIILHLLKLYQPEPQR